MRANHSGSDLSPSCRRLFTGLCTAALLQLLSPATEAAAQSVGIPLTVSRVSRERVDLAVPTGRGPREGSRLVIERDGKLVAELEVEHTSLLFVSCRVERELEPIVLGDKARLIQAPGQPESAQTPTAPPISAPSEPQPQLASPPPGPAATEILVRQVMGASIYLNAGRGIGLVVGQRLEVQHDGVKVAVIEVEFLSERSSSCKLIEASAALATGDRAIPGPPPAVAAGTPLATPTSKSPQGSSRDARGTAAKPAATPGWADASGSVALRFQGFRDDAADGRDTDQLSAVVNLNLRHLGGTPLEIRARLRTGQDRITRSGAATETRPNDRFYELSLGYAPPGGSYSYHLGRLTAGPEVGFDYLDGVMGEFRATPRWGVGGFYGNRVEVDELAYDSGGSAYGVFLHHLEESKDRPFFAETFVSAIGEYRGGEVNREYVSVYGRQGSGSKWSLYERAELDLNRDWRQDMGGAGTQLSNLLFSGTYTATKAIRLGLTYDERRQYRTLDDRDTPEELFDDALREGLRFNVYLGTGKSVRANLSVGLRRRADSPEKNETYNGSVYYSNLFGWNLLVGADYASFSGETSKGDRMGLRFQKYFANGHDLELTVGRSTSTLMALGERRENQWVRLSGSALFGRRFFVLGEIEVTTGDDLAGQRIFLQLGYRL